MTVWEAVLLFAAGIGGGLAGSVAGLASVATYPALLLVGLPPVTANMTNTVALVFNGVGSVLGSLPELRGQRAELTRLIPIGGGRRCGGRRAAVVHPRRGLREGRADADRRLGHPDRVAQPPTRRGARPQQVRQVLEGLAIFAICVYGGFFGAAAGVLLLALFLRTGSASLAHANATKNVVLGVANAVAALAFIAFGPIDWLAVVPMGIGCLLGSRLGPVVVRHAPATPVRLVIAVAGLALAVKLGLDTYR